ncbi:MAG TPA: RNA polymerase sigma factor [Candidatus Saccharimonadales bacterium]|nr:RNA polymerase sigma factor [Candidatus Saccharimonadales bacterium]
MDIDEPRLIASILSGEKDDYRHLVDRYKNDVYRHCFYILRDEDTAEDMAQEAFIKAYRNLHRYDTAKASFKTWIFTIATRECLSYLRQNKHLPLEDEEIAISTYAPVDQQAKEREIYDAVRSLRPKYRTVIVLHYWQGYSYEKMAETMGVPIGTVRGWLFRAKKELKEALS